MLQKFILSLLTMLVSLGVFSQSVKLVLTTDCKNKANAKQVHCIDKRDNRNMLGILQTGLSNRMSWVLYEGDFMKSISQYFKGKPNENFDCEEIAIVLNDIFLSETTKLISETGSVRLDMRIFIAKEKNQFQEVMTIDSVFQVQGNDVTQHLLRSVSARFCTISDELEDKMNQRPLNNSIYSLDDLYKLDSIEKLKIPMYNSEKPQAGIYRTFESFKANEPDSVKLRIDDNRMYAIVYTYSGRKLNHPKGLFVDNVYAVSDGEALFVATNQGYVKTVKQNGDYVLAYPQVFRDKGNVVFWGLMFGVVGAVVANSVATSNSKTLNLKINYSNGKLIPFSSVE